jgi:hypothetical protein
MLRPSVRLGVRALKDARAEAQEKTPSNNPLPKRKDGQQRFGSPALVSMGAPTRPSAREESDSGVRQPHLSGTGRRKDKVPNRGKTRGVAPGASLAVAVCCIFAAWLLPPPAAACGLSVRPSPRPRVAKP